MASKSKNRSGPRQDTAVRPERRSDASHSSERDGSIPLSAATDPNKNTSDKSPGRVPGITEFTKISPNSPIMSRAPLSAVSKQKQAGSVSKMKTKPSRSVNNEKDYAFWGTVPSRDTSRSNIKKGSATALDSPSRTGNSRSQKILEHEDQQAGAGEAATMFQRSPEVNEQFCEQFKLFAKFGNHFNTGTTIALGNSDKWLKQADVINNHEILSTETAIPFNQIAQKKKCLTYEEYLRFLELLTETKKLDFRKVMESMASCGPPTIRGTTKALKGGCVARLTDTTKYTGTHKYRFDQSGRGRGLKGRKDFVIETGYVNGYRNKGTYDVTH